MKKTCAIFCIAIMTIIIITMIMKDFRFEIFPKEFSFFGSSFMDLVVAFFGLSLWREFHHYKETQKREAAIQAYASIRAYKDYINEVIALPYYYENEGYYPFSIPEIDNKYESRSRDNRERPARLIFNRTGLLRNILYEHPHIGEEEYEDLEIFFNNVSKYSKILENSLYQRSRYEVQKINAIKTQDIEVMISNLTLRLEECSKNINDECNKIIIRLKKIIGLNRKINQKVNFVRTKRLLGYKIDTNE